MYQNWLKHIAYEKARFIEQIRVNLTWLDNKSEGSYIFEENDEILFSDVQIFQPNGIHAVHLKIANRDALVYIPDEFLIWKIDSKKKIRESCDSPKFSL